MINITVRTELEGDSDQLLTVISLATEDLRRIYRPTVAASIPSAPTARFVAEIAGKIVGTLKFSEDSDRLHITGLMVHPSYRHLGVARALVDAVAEAARASAITKLSLYTIRQTGNIDVFRKLGFVVIREDQADWAESIDSQSLTEIYMERAI